MFGLVVDCEKLGRRLPLGITTDLQSFSLISPMKLKVRCACCRGEHMLKIENVPEDGSRVQRAA